MRAPCFLLTLALASTLGCDPGPPLAAERAEVSTPTVAEVLYPAVATPLFAHAAFRHLPADLKWVVVVDLPAALTASGLGKTFASGGEPYDQAVEALSLHGLGLGLETLAEVGDAGFDLASPWGISEITGEPIAFGRVADATALRARLGRDRKLVENELGPGRYIELREDEDERGLWLVGDVAFMLRGPYGRAKKQAEQLAAVTADTSLAQHADFQRAVKGLRFGRHAAAYVGLADQKLSAEVDVRLLEHRYEQLAEWIEKLAGDEDAAKVAEVRERLSHRDEEIAAAKKRAEALAAIPPLHGVALGLDVDTTTFRGKAFLPLGDGVAKQVFGEAALPVDPKATAKPPKADEHWRLSLTPAAALEIATRTLGSTELRALERWLKEVRPDAPALVDWLSGATSRGRYTVDGRTAFRLELGVRPELAPQLRALRESVKPVDEEGKLIAVEGDRIHLRLGPDERWIRSYEGGVVIASHESLLDVASPRLSEDPRRQVAALALLPSSVSGARDGLLLAHFEPRFGRPQFWGDSLSAFSSMGILGLMGSSSSGRATSEEAAALEKKRKRLEKRRAKVRAELETL
ncbi:MAG: hypothetical protein KC731_40370, partial [Myxococcales bacterium]|nr:hypothetical protein [Myxococcales bacterium]